MLIVSRFLTSSTYIAIKSQCSSHNEKIFVIHRTFPISHKMIIYRYINVLYYLLKRYRALLKGELEALQRSWGVMAACMTEVTLLRLFFAFLNTSPQFILQLYLLVQMETKANSSEGKLILCLSTKIIYYKYFNNNCVSHRMD